MPPKYINGLLNVDYILHLERLIQKIAYTLVLLDSCQAEDKLTELYPTAIENIKHYIPQSFKHL